MKLSRDDKGEPLTYEGGECWKLIHGKDYLLIPAGSKLVTVGDLKDQIGTSGPRPDLYCAACGNEYSANAGDYFNHPFNHVFVCCDEPMKLCVRRVTHEEVL